MVAILEGKYSYEELSNMPMSEIEIILEANQELIKLRNKMLEEEKKKTETKAKSKTPKPVSYDF